MLPIKKQRDITLIKRAEHKTLIIACDSCGGIGNKEMDLLKVSPKIVGYYTTRVALMELLSVGATPIAVINTLSVEMEPTGKEIIKGIEGLMAEAEVSLEMINGSTEENFETLQTGVGITIIGEVEDEKCKINRTKSEDLVYLVGVPKVGGEIEAPYDSTICSIASLKKLVETDVVKEIIPIGSKGIRYEAEVLAHLNGLRFLSEEKEVFDMNKSAGPATAVIFTIHPEGESTIRDIINQPISKIGIMI